MPRARKINLEKVRASLDITESLRFGSGGLPLPPGCQDFMPRLRQ
jgi:hypothetical protein